ncbi:L-alanine-DL-glutamate epimerase-like enolase superfamily enzyme [Hydrogenispora ethanolica]|uniref:L-alanine-DL-glutamate epimerase-like enolase superfamily enzyme n=2 Tax=Hydrogenispora ethanolica TaxID=1082276 RepID=A0A4R1R9Y2_HYDET|nr:L-alanine-DL-glutamate epimerase-like enolase superfamily enzyme [Hydrogenispora ethanolica]
MDMSNQQLRFSKAVVSTFAPIALPRPFFDSTGGPFDCVPMEGWVQLFDEDGLCGQAPCSPQFQEVILPLIMTGAKKTYDEWYHQVYWKLRNRGFSSEAIVDFGKFDLALNDILAKRAGLPLHRFWGAERDWVHVYGSAGGTGLTDAELESEITSLVQEGYSVIKMKIATNFGTEVERDVRRIAMVRKLVGEKIQIAIDANQCWDAQTACRFAERVAEYDIAWFEEPVHAWNFGELGKLTKICPIPVSMGESMRTQYMFEEYAKLGVSHLQPVPSSMGGIREWFRIRDIAKEYGLRFSSGGLSQITGAYIATASEDAMVEYLTPIMKSFVALMKLAPEARDGKFYLPSEPGLPVDPDWNLLEREGLLRKKEYFYSK